MAMCLSRKTLKTQVNRKTGSVLAENPAQRIEFLRRVGRDESDRRVFHCEGLCRKGTTSLPDFFKIHPASSTIQSTSAAQPKNTTAASVRDRASSRELAVAIMVSLSPRSIGRTRFSPFLRR